ncbi:MAG: response regulator, partial [Alphaproteobacteria bacterium]|nr:response regulator [Alphaproteobacteria bacterium]
IFEPFFTTKNAAQGSGLGLSQVFGFVKQSGGHVKAYSEPGAGTTMKLYFPRHHGPAADADAVPARASAPDGNGERILVVEDDPDVRQFTVQALRLHGFSPIEADGPATALRLLESEPDIALMFTDVVMPGMTGRVLADRAQALRPGLKVLFMTGYARNAIVHHGVLDPGVELLPKPFTPAALVRKIGEMLGR